MLTTNMSGTILIRENTLLPEGLAIESEVFLPGWRVVKNLDAPTLARNIEGANWNFFYLAGATRTTVLGRDQLGTLRRAAKRVLAKQEIQFNSLEMRVVSKRFLGIPFMSVAAYSRHIQQGICLVPGKDFVLGMPASVAPEASLGNAREKPKPHADVITKPRTALDSSS
jgi:hypothetical protein